MHLRDLRNLARTSKPFRALLISRSAKPFWKASIAGVEGLPKCPPYLSEPCLRQLTLLLPLSCKSLSHARFTCQVLYLFRLHELQNCLKPSMKTVQF